MTTKYEGKSANLPILFVDYNFGPSGDFALISTEFATKICIEHVA